MTASSGNSGIIIREDNYFDKNGIDKRESIAKLKEYIFYIYYVLMTRGIKEERVSSPYFLANVLSFPAFLISDGA